MEHLSRQFGIGSTTKQRAIGNEDLAAPQSIEPFFVAGCAADVDVEPVITHRIGQNAAGTAGRWRQTQATIEQVIVYRLRPEAVALRAWPLLAIASLAPRLVAH